ncbi:FMN-binding protein [Ligilactobacillus salivarius]|nr:FMN-binding protein [Ligilactobacillus salivarius]MDM8223619.1 FMN-binding protein [Ligilactobacillus salivarius]
MAFEVRGCPRGRKATISSSATKRTSAKSGGNSKGLTSKAKSNFFVRNHVPHLYGAGELGGISAGRYQAGENIAECLIFGKIAGLNAARVKETYMVGVNQYLGRSNAGVGNEVVVRITVDDDKKLKDIEILKQSETGIGAQAIESILKEMISKNTYEVDSISGASATSRALKKAVKDAMNKI